MWCKVGEHFILLHVDIQLYQHCLFKILFFLALNTRGTLSLESQ